MPRDKRLWMTFPNDFWMHPKVAPLSDSAFRAFVEMNGYSRTQRLDGVIPTRAAERLWAKDALGELVASDPERPLVLKESRSYVIRDYAEHQELVADEDARRDRNRENGSKGGRPKTQTKTQSVTESEPNPNPDETETKPESESASEPDSSKTSTSQSGSNRARDLTDEGFSTEMARVLAAQAGIDNPKQLAGVIRSELGLSVHWDHMAAIVNHVATWSAKPPTKAVGFAVTCMRNDPEKVKKFIYEQGFALDGK